jgi:hypothetical protein
MTDLLTRDPNDTGEIPIAEPGQTTRNLTWITQAPALRRPDATFKTGVVEGGCRTVVPNDEDFDSGPIVPLPDPLPAPPPPAPKVDDRPLSDGEEVAWTSTWRPTVRTPGYVGRHRKVSRWDRVRVALAIAWAPIRGAF